MATVHEELTDDLQDFIRAQNMFFIATAPLSADGMVNCSPKGLDTLSIIDRHTLAYLDLTGSGAETIAHLKENGRFVMMFCSFSKRPMILRLHGRGEVIESHDAAWQALIERFPRRAGTRAIIRLNVTRVCDSCGWGVPVMDFTADRDTYANYVATRDGEALQRGQTEKNMHSLDGLPGLSQPTSIEALALDD